MATITITHAAHALIRAATTPGYEFLDTAVPRPDGLLDIPIDDEVAARINLLRYPGESDSDVIVRVFSTVGHKPS